MVLGKIVVFGGGAEGSFLFVRTLANNCGRIRIIFQFLTLLLLLRQGALMDVKTIG